MTRFAHAAIALFVVSGASVAQQPLTYPGRSQSPGQQAVDNAACYADANKTTKVNMAHESQRPPPPGKAAAVAPRPIVAPSPVNPPLPSAMGASGAMAASAPAGASGAAIATAASGASGVAVPSTVAAASGASGTLAASGATPASDTLAASGASMPSAASLAAMPPPPPPEPPMVRYWTAYSKCMQQRGYYTR
ncbi:MULTISPECIES: hypothetical protein [Paraburkholderia]|jgi:hypothetical protein|uniref:Uncharacterized protein n=1 Tax=Paraburkholderia hospita TaxID=169430 RepID=A0AAN1J624_9BURK|nr:hypothetical protein [Paraburkholderia hospita]AUT68174.1 hypothetical protein C2L64_07370 [Paraburkholderia hospita]